MRKSIYGLLLLICLGITAVTSAAEEARQAVKPENVAATNLAANYPVAKTKLPLVPVPPASTQDAKATAAYIAAVDAYLKAAQSYIDATTNDLNFIIAERNTAIESANQVLAGYNAFFKIESKQK